MNLWHLSLGGKLSLCHLVAISSVMLLLNSSPEFEPVMMILLAMLVFLSLPIFFPAIIPTIDGGPLEGSALIGLLGFLAWMAINSFVFGYGLAAFGQLAAKRKALRLRETQPKGEQGNASH